MNLKYMDIAIKESYKAIKDGDIPVGAVIVKNDIVISKSYNQKTKKGIATNHAEIIAINKACAKIGDWRLNNCEMYVTLEPCCMCKGAVEEARIERVYYLLPSSYYKNKTNYDNYEMVKNGKYVSYRKYVDNFFKSIRK